MTKDVTNQIFCTTAYKTKVTNVFKVIIITCLVITFTVSMAACEKPPVVEEQQQEEKEKAEVIIPSETKEETKETPPVVEEIPEKIEWEGVTFSPIEGLRFDKGDFYFMEGNEYGGVVGEKAGVLIPKDAVEIDGVMQGAFGFVPKVLEVWIQKKIEEEKKFAYPFPLDLEQTEGIKIREVVYKKLYTDLPEEIFGQKEVKPMVGWLDFKSGDPYFVEDTFLDKNLASLTISNMPIGTKIYSPANTSDSGYLIWDNNCGRNDSSEPSWHELNFEIITPETYKEGLLFNNERVDIVRLGFSIMGVSLLPSGIEKNIAENKAGGYSFLTEIKMGLPIAEVVEEGTLSPFEFRELDEFDSPPTSADPQIKMSCAIYQLRNKDGQVEFSNISKALELGLAGLFKIGNIPVFISP